MTNILHPEETAAVTAVTRWEYRTLDLNDLPRRVSELDLLNTAGGVGWELIAITANRIGFFTRRIDDEPAQDRAPRRGR